MYSETKLFNRIARSHMYWGRKPLTGLNNAFRDVKKGEIVLDPLCGGGTSLIAALSRGARVIGCDLNPMAVFISKVLLRPVNISTLETEFKKIETTISEKILNYYTAMCPHCRRHAYIDYTVWVKGKQYSRPEKMSVQCPYCKKNELVELSPAKQRRQMRMSKISPQCWYPKTHIKSKRLPPVQCHYELFTGRNLTALADLNHTINKISDESCREALQYVFTAMLYNCSEMQMFSEKEPSSSRGWTACRYYVPPKRKEKNVWLAFCNRYKSFISCKKAINSLIPHVRITDSLKTFLDKEYEAVIFNADVFRMKQNLMQLANHVFLDPPYNDDIDYFAFSEFWGSWLKMSFDFEAEWHSRETKTKGLRRVLKSLHRKTSDSCNVYFAFGAKKPEEWDADKCILESGYNIVSHKSFFFYDNSHKRGFLRSGGVGKEEDYFLSLKKVNTIKKKKCAKRKPTSSFQKKEMQFYLRAKRFISPDSSDETFRADTAHSIPYRLNEVLGNTIGDTYENIEKDRSLWQKTYYSYCCVLLIKILARDGWELKSINRTLLAEDEVFGKFLGKKKVPNEPDMSAIAFSFKKKKNKTIIFCFDSQKRKRTLINRFLKDDVQRDCVCVMITACKEDMDELREVGNASKWPGGFFTSYDEILKKYSEVTRGNNFELPLSKNSEKSISQQVTTFKATVRENLRVGCNKSNHYEHYKLRFHAPELQEIVPGQFVMIDTKPFKRKTWKPTPLLRTNLDLKPHSFLKRPFGIHRAFYENFKPNYLKNLSLPPNLATILHTVRPDVFDISYKVLTNGMGTNELKELKKDDTLEMMGPLGKKYSLENLRTQGFKEVHVIGGGVGMAPLVFMVQALVFYSFRVKAFIGIESLELLKYENAIDRSHAEDPDNIRLYIDDLLAAGLKHKDIFVSFIQEPSYDIGEIKLHKGFVSEQYEEYLQSNHRPEHKKMAFTCGPQQMMKAVETITNRHDIPLNVLMEKRMACGIGVCFSCVCKTEKNGKEQYSRVCTDGPIFEAKEIREWKKKK